MRHWESDKEKLGKNAMLPHRQTAASTAAAAAPHWSASPFDAWSMPSPVDAPFATSSPGVESDHTSDDTGDHFDFDDTLELVAHDGNAEFFSIGDGPLPATVEKAISAVYEEMTREENAERGYGFWGGVKPEEHTRDADEDKEELRSANYGGTVHRQSNTSSGDSDDAMPTIDSGTSKRARRSEIEKKSRQRRQVRL